MLWILCHGDPYGVPGATASITTAGSVKRPAKDDESKRGQDDKFSL